MIDVKATVLDGQRELFGIPADLAYFNCASLAPLMLSAREAGRRAFDLRGEPWRIETADWFDDVERRRSLFAQFVGVSAENVALVPATSYGLSIAARNLRARPEQRVLVLADEFPSNYYTWRTFCARHRCELVTVQRAPGQEWTEAVLRALDERVAIAAVPNVHWTNGAPLDLVAIGERVRAVGAHLVVDASQSLGAMPFDFATVRPDFLVAVGYKWLLGPFGLGYLYVAEAHLEGEPLEENWISRAGSDDFTSTAYHDAYRGGARRYDVGQRSMLEATPPAIAVLEQLVAWGVESISSSLAAKTDRIARESAAMGLSLATEGRRASHMLGVSLPEKTRAAAARLLVESRVHVAVRGPGMRISPHVYNDDRDIDRLLEALGRLTDSSSSPRL